MNLKKFISGVSALTIAASAFAGLAVTAGAVEYDATNIYSKTDLSLADVTAAGAEGATLSDGTDTDNGISFVNVATSTGTAAKTYQGFTLSTGVTDKGIVDIQYKLRIHSAAGTNAYTGLKNAGNSLVGAYYRSGKTNAWGYVGFTGSSNSQYGSAWVADTWYNVSEKVNLDEAKIVNFTVTSLDGKTTMVDTNAVTVDLSSVASLTFATASGFAGYASDFDIADVKIDSLVAKGYNVTINTAPYAKITDGTTTVYSDYLGKATVKEPVDAVVNYTISKGEYTDGSISITFDSEKSVDAALTPAADGVQFTEDYANTGITSGLYGMQTAAGGNNAWSRISSGKAEFIGGGSGNRSFNVPFTYTAVDADIYTLTYDTSVYDASNKDKERYSTVTAKDVNGKTLATIKYENSDVTNIDKITVNETVAETPSVNNVTVKVNTKTGEVTTSTSGVDSTITVEGAGAPASLNVDLGRNHRITLDNIVVKGENIPTYTVTIVDGDSTTSDTYNEGDTFTLPAAAGKEGYDFKGWSDGTNTIDANTEVTVTADVTYTAVYEETYVPAPSFKATAANFGVAKADDDETKVASYFTVEVTNEGTAEGTFNTITVTGDGTEYHNENAVNKTLAVGASVVYGAIIDGVALSAAPTATAN